MQMEGGDLTIVFNGEIYNYRELREELRQAGRSFHSASDTEVLLAAWSEWGKACLPRLEGMFAFVVHDRKRRKLTCVRDAFGIKPFFYSQDKAGVFFASEQQALRTLRGTSLRPDLQQAYDYLVHGDYDSQESTFVEGVRHLPPGTLLEIDPLAPDAARPEGWWRVPTQERPWTFDEAVEALRAQFLHNIRLHLRSDVPLGAALSGGIDSSAVVCAMRHLEPDAPIHTFSYIAEGSVLSEAKWVDRINQRVGAIPHLVTTSAREVARDIDAVIAAQGEPFGSTSIYAQYRVFQAAREHGITVTLDGQGADEMFAGYIGYPGQRLLSLLETGHFRHAWRFARDWGGWPGRSSGLAWMHWARTVCSDRYLALARRATGRDFRPDWLDIELLRDAGVEFRERSPVRLPANRGRRVIEQLAYSLQRRNLPALLRHGDRNSMAFSIESRVPFLTVPMAELALSMPEDFLISNVGQTKRVFRAAMRGIVPDAILDRRDKIGFDTPELEWVRAVAPQVRIWLEDSAQIPFLKRNSILETFDAILAGRVKFTWQVWRWINYVRWHARAQ